MQEKAYVLAGIVPEAHADHRIEITNPNVFRLLDLCNRHHSAKPGGRNDTASGADFEHLYIKFSGKSIDHGRAVKSAAGDLLQGFKDTDRDSVAVLSHQVLDLSQGLDSQ